MQVKIKDKVYDSHNEPIMLILQDYNREDIKKMPEGSHKYCEFPDHMSEEEIRDFMKI